jgi:hypothetical protein
MKSKQHSFKIFLFYFFLSTIFSCEKIEKTIDEPLPEFYLTSTITEANETQVKVKGEISTKRALSKDVMGVVYSEKPFPTIENDKILISSDKGAFDITVKNLKPKTAYYFRSYLQTNDKIYYSNQLSSTPLYDNRWQRLSDFPSDLIYSTGILYIGEYEEGSQPIFVGSEKEEKDLSFYYTFNYQNLNLSEQKWTYNTYRGNILGFSGLKDLYIVNPNRDRVFIGGGYRINNSLTSPRVYNQNIWKNGSLQFNLPCPIETETAGITINDRMFVIATESNGEVYEFTNLQWDRMKNNTFINLGRVKATGTRTRGYIISESETPQIQGGKLYEFDPDTENWTPKKTFAGDERVEGILFATKEKVYYGLGRNKKSLQALKDIWEYDPKIDNWKQIAVYPGNGNVRLVQTVFKDVVYFGMGYQTFLNQNEATESGGVKDFWVFRP